VPDRDAVVTGAIVTHLRAGEEPFVALPALVAPALAVATLVLQAA